MPSIIGAAKSGTMRKSKQWITFSPKFKCTLENFNNTADTFVANVIYIDHTKL